MIPSTGAFACPIGSALDARIVPAFSGGRAIGFKLFAVKRGGLYHLLGLTSGDLVRTINGLDLTSPDKALSAYSEILGANRVVIEVERGRRTILLAASLPTSRDLLARFPRIELPSHSANLRDRALVDLVRWRAALSTAPRPESLEALRRDLDERLGPFEPLLPPLLDPWRRPYFFRQPRARDLGCISSRGPDGRPGTSDDIVLACEEQPRPLMNAVRACRASKEVVLRPKGDRVFAWFLGADARPDTSDDEVELVDAPDCAERLRASVALGSTASDGLGAEVPGEAARP
jgi:hypothetical protein